jgi:two-component system osmolarity sensor histidine kinase EnvZ
MSVLGSTRRRVTLLLALAVLATLAFAIGAVAWQSMRAGAGQIARVVAAALHGAERAYSVDAGLPATLRALGFEQTVGATPAQEAAYLPPLAAEVRSRLEALVDDRRRLRFEGGPEWRIWLQVSGAPSHWIGIAVEPVRDQVLRGSLLVLLAAGGLVLLFAGSIARQLTRPLEALARQAPALVAGLAAPDVGDDPPTEVRELAAALGSAARAQAAMARERELLLAGVSHDLRTPLARLRVALELGDAADPERRAEMGRDLDELDAVIAAFLDHVRDGSDEVATNIDPTALVGQLLAERDQQANWCATNAGAPATVRLRPLAARRALRNLMDNAERHGQPPFEVEVRAAPGGVAFRIRDHGRGVDADLLALLGRPFVRGDAARNTTGTGLGLASAARIAAAHHGTLALRNGEHGGGFEALLSLAEDQRPLS